MEPRISTARQGRGALTAAESYSNSHWMEQKPFSIPLVAGMARGQQPALFGEQGHFTEQRNLAARTTTGWSSSSPKMAKNPCSIPSPAEATAGYRLPV